MTSPKEQPAVDTSAEKLLALAEDADRLLYGAINSYRLRDELNVISRIGQALRSLAAHPAEPEATEELGDVLFEASGKKWVPWPPGKSAELEGMELETTAEERAEDLEMFEPYAFNARLVRDFNRMRARADKAEAFKATMVETLDGYDAALARREHGDIAAHNVVRALRAALSRPEGSAT